MRCAEQLIWLAKVEGTLLGVWLGAGQQVLSKKTHLSTKILSTKTKGVEQKTNVLSGVGRTHLANAVKEGEWDCIAACVMHLPLPDVFCLSALPPPGLHRSQISIGQVFAL